MRAELCGCALQRNAAGNFAKLGRKNPYITFGRRRARGQNRSVNNETYGDVLVKGEEERGSGTRCVRARYRLPRAREGGTTTPALFLLVKDTPRRIYFTKVT